MNKKIEKIILEKLKKIKLELEKTGENKIRESFKKWNKEEKESNLLEILKKGGAKTKEKEIDKKNYYENEYRIEKNRIKFPDLCLIFIEQKEKLEESHKKENMVKDWTYEECRKIKYGERKQKIVIRNKPKKAVTKIF